MKISDVVSSMTGGPLPALALAIAGLAFLVVVITTFLRRNREPFERARFIPLDAQEKAHE